MLWTALPPCALCRMSLSVMASAFLAPGPPLSAARRLRLRGSRKTRRRRIGRRDGDEAEQGAAERDAHEAAPHSTIMRANGHEGNRAERSAAPVEQHR